MVYGIYSNMNFNKQFQNVIYFKKVDVKFERDLKRFIPLSELKQYHLEHKKEGKGPLQNLSLFTRSRLSVQSIKNEEWEFIVNLENQKVQS